MSEARITDKLESQEEVKTPLAGEASSKQLAAGPAAGRRILSGMRPTGKLHLGNLVGALENWVRLQDSMPCIYCVVDMHAITVWQDPAELSASTREVAAACMAVPRLVRKKR